MRKQFRNKRRACALCKPHKRGWEYRFKAAERAGRRAAEHEVRAASVRCRAVPPS
jgi:hypothetical protein